MCLNSDINYEKLDATYDLGPLYGLKRATPLEKEECKRANPLLKTFGDPIMLGEWSPFQRMVKKETVMLDDEPSKENIQYAPKTKKTSKVYFGRNATMRKSLEHIYKHRHSDDFSDKIYNESPNQSQCTSYSVTDLLEEDPFDYDIVNIDNDLLTIPEALSCEQLTPGAQSWRQSKLSEIKMRTRSRGSINYNPKQKEEVETVVYHGEPNAFIIELFGFYEDVHDRHAFDLLEAAFEIMKNYDYCLIRVPCKDKTFPLLQHFCYVPTRPKICSKYALYVAHRSSVLGKLRVRPAEVVDVPQISQMLQNLEGKETIWTIENSILSNDNHSAFVFLSGFAIVGVGILESPEQIDFIRVKFNLDLYHNHKYHFRSQGTSAGFTTLKTVIAYPAFEVHYRYFAREMMRMTGTNSMLWLTAYRNKWVGHKANSLVSAMIPLIPRKSEIDCVEIPELKKISNLAQKITAFTTWFLGKNMTTIPKVDINVRILVVGASRTTMSFLDTLLFSDASSYLNFTNVTLISPNGLPYVRQAKPAAEMMFPRYRNTADKFLKSVPYTYYVNVVQGTMTEINKKEHYVTLSNGSVYFYDLLFLLLGKQYQHPNYLQELYERETEAEECKYTRLDVPRLYQESDIDLSTEYLPDNVFIINNISEANRALKYVKNFFWQDFNYKILVYGASIHAYCCLAALLEFQVPPENIVFIEPFPYENGKTRVPVFCNENVDESVKEVLNNLNITVYRSYYFQSWTVDGYNMVTHVDFLSHFQMVKLECTVFFYYGKTGVSTQALNAIKKSGLVYDGGILIDHEFRTKDPCIYAAGPATRYYRRYFADTRRLKYYDSYEVGQKLGTQIRNQLDPLFSPKEPSRKSSVTVSTSTIMSEPVSLQSQTSSSTKPSDSSIASDGSGDKHLEKIPTLKKPIVTHCTLPGRLQYLEVRPPGKMTPHYYVQSKQFTKIDDPLPERVCGRDMVVEKETYKTTTGEYCVKPNPNKAMERADCSINCRRVIFMTGVEKRLQGKSIVQPTMISEMKDNFRGVMEQATMPPEITVRAPDPEYIFDVVAAGRNEAPVISDSAGGFRRLLDPYVTTYRACHKPFSVEDQYGIGAKDQITFYSAFNLPKVRGFGPRHQEIWMPLTSKVHRGVYDRIHVKKEYKEVAACHNPVNNIKGVFESEMKKKYKIPFAYSSLASWGHGENFDLAPFPPNPYQTNIAPFMYCSDYCHIAQGTPPYTVIDQLQHKLPVHKKCMKRMIVSRDYDP